MSRHAGPSGKPWAVRQGGHPLGGGGGAMPSSQPELSSRPAAPSSRPAASLALPRFMAQPQHSGWQHSMQRQQAPQQSQQRPTLLAPPPPIAALRLSQAAFGGSQPLAFAPWSQRSQEDAILVASGLDAAGLGLREELTVGENIPVSQEVARGGAVDGSAPQAQHQPAELEVVDLGSQQATTRPAQAAAKLLEAINRTGAGAPVGVDLKPLGTKLDAMEGRQGELAAAVGSLQADVSAQGSALQGLGQTCSQLLRAVQTITGASGTIQDHLQALLDRCQPRQLITGDMATQTSPQPAAQAAVVAHGTQTSPLQSLQQPAALQPPTALLAVRSLPAQPTRVPGLAAKVPVETAAAAQVPPAILRAFNQRRPSSAAAQPAPPTKPTVAPAVGAPARRGLSGAAAASPCPAPALRAAAAAHAASPPAKPTKPTEPTMPTKPTTSSRAVRAAPAPQTARRRSRRTAEPQQQQQQQERPAAAGRQTGQRTAVKAAALAGAAQPAGPHAGSQPAPHAPPPASMAPSLASFGRKRRLSTETEPACTAPLSQQQRLQERVGKRQRRVPAPPPSRRPSSQPHAPPRGQAAQRSMPATQTEALFDSLFGGSDAADPEPPANDLAAAVQRQLARSVARHARRVAQSRQQLAGVGGAVWLSQPVEGDS